MPPKEPLKPVIHGRIDRGDYTVEKVFFASMPGHYVSGNLYRPAKVKGKVPGVLCPHGHWKNGRFYDAGNKEAESQIGQGAEKTMAGARLPAAGPHGRAGAARLRRVPLRHGRRRRQPADQTRLGLRRRRGRIAVAKRDGPADLEFDPRPRFHLVASRRRSEADRRHRSQRRRDADVYFVRDRSAAGRRLSGRDGLDQHAGGLRLRDGRPLADWDQQRGHRRRVRPQAAGDERRPRLDDRPRTQGPARTEAGLFALRPGRRRLRQGLSAVRPQLQPRLAATDVRVVQRAPQTRSQVADRRTGFLAASLRRNCRCSMPNIRGRPTRWRPPSCEKR